jgi:hypothetical protein
MSSNAFFHENKTQITAVFMYLYHILLVIFLSSFAPLRLCVRLKNVVHLPENRCKQNPGNING